MSDNNQNNSDKNISKEEFQEEIIKVVKSKIIYLSLQMLK